MKVTNLLCVYRQYHYSRVCYFFLFHNFFTLSQLCFLFKNNAKNDILKSKERLVKVFMDKYEEMQKDDELWSTAMAIQMGEARYRYGLEDSFEEGKKKGEELLLIKLIKSKYHEDCSAWLQSLSNEQIEAVSSLILICNTFQELKDQVMSMK